MKETKCYCDICKTEGARTYSVLTYRTFDSTDGRFCYNKPQFYVENLDLCDKCAIKSTNIHSIGVQCNKYELKNNWRRI